MILIFLALMMVFGLVFGTGAMVVDVGYTMGQQAVMQNAADAGALSAAKLMAGSVTSGVPFPDGTARPVFLVSDADVHQAAKTFTDANKSGGTSGSGYEIAVEYLDCNGKPAGTTPFSARSFTDPRPSNVTTRLATDVATAQGLANNSYIPAATTIGDQSSWTAPICEVRVYARVTNPALLGSVPAPGIGFAGLRTEAATAHGTARIYPTSPPPTITGTWPMTHHIDPADPTTLPENCQYPTACKFWDPPNGSFKEIIDLSRYSHLFPTPVPEQLFWPAVGSSSPPNLLLPLHEDTSSPVKYDPNPTTQSTPASTNDIAYWFQHGWWGKLIAYSDPANPTQPDPRCLDATKVLAQCPNSRLEVGPSGSRNYAPDIKTGITNFRKGTDPVLGDYATLPVYLWQFGETDPTSSGNKLWKNLNDGPYTKVTRIIVQEVRLFRFYTNEINSSSAGGYYIGFYNPDGTPGDGPPNTVANTVRLVN